MYVFDMNNLQLFGRIAFLEFVSFKETYIYFNF